MLELDARAQPTTRSLDVLDLGTIGYAECWDMQKRLAADLGEGRGSDTLLLLEHPHTYTCGRRGGRDHLLIGPADLERLGVTVLDVDRGGDITYHGPGQLVAYPILRLADQDGKLDYHAYLRALEQTLIDTLAYFAIAAHRVPDYSGVWTVQDAEEKIAAIGVKVDGRGVSTHGVALNVATDLSYFSRIVPCGISDKGVTSMSRLSASPPAIDEVKRVFISCFSEVFGFSHVG